VIHRFLATAVFHTTAAALVAERLLEKHAVVDVADVSTQHIETTEYAEPPLTSWSDLRGLRLKRIVPAGAVLVRSMFEAVPLVRSGSEVTILVTTGAVRVKTRGMARGDGGMGDRVAVRPAGGHRELKGVVVGDEVVEVAAE
jgi:flagella basal body P-ring formation protein FlgA